MSLRALAKQSDCKAVILRAIARRTSWKIKEIPRSARDDPLGQIATPSSRVAMTKKKFPIQRLKICLGPLLIIVFFSSFSYAKETPQVDINTASIEELMKVPGIGKVLAQRIVQYRQEKGEFRNLKDLLSVRGIDKKRFAKFKPYLIITLPGDKQVEKDFEKLSEDLEAGSLITADLEQLQEYRARPLNLNTAGLDQLLDLPGITPKIARAIIKYRFKHRGFGSLAELKKVKGMSNKLLKQISPYIILGKRRNFAADFRLRWGIWPLPLKDYSSYPEEYQHPAYFYNRLRFQWRNQLELGGIIKKDRFSLPLNYPNLKEYYFIKKWLVLRDLPILNKLILGNYRLEFAQGLVLGSEPFLVRNIPYKPLGIREDKGTHYNQYFDGIAFTKQIREFQFWGFYSNKSLTAYLNQDGTVHNNLSAIHEYSMNYLNYENEKNIEYHNSLSERLIGARLKYSLPDVTLGIIGYQNNHNPVINPYAYNRHTRKYDIWMEPYVFHGNKNCVFGADLELRYKNLEIFGELARSQHHIFNEEGEYQWKNGDAFTIMPMLYFKNLSLWLQYHWLAPNYYAEHSSPWTSLDIESGNNERGGILGANYKWRKFQSQISFELASPIAPTYYNPEIPESLYKEFWWDFKYRPVRKLEIYLRNWQGWEERKPSGYDPPEIRELLAEGFTPYAWTKRRLQITYAAMKNLRLRLRYETRKNTFLALPQSIKGYVTFAEVQYKATPLFTISTRAVYFAAPRGVTVGETEWVWPRAISSFYWFTPSGGARGYRLYIMPVWKLSPEMEIWCKYEYLHRNDQRVRQNQISPEHVFKLACDWSW